MMRVLLAALTLVEIVTGAVTLAWLWAEAVPVGHPPLLLRRIRAHRRRTAGAVPHPLRSADVVQVWTIL